MSETEQATALAARVAALEQELERSLLERRRWEARLRDLADHDSLTGFLNRRRFGDEIEHRLNLSRRYGGGFAVLVLGLDRFRNVNNRYGHAVGDQVLLTASHVLRGRCRRTDVIARLDGDEFGVILPHCTPPEAEMTARLLQDAIRTRCTVTAGARELRLTASVGLRAVEHHEPVEPSDLLTDAEIALDDAKEQGRNRVSVAGVGTAEPARVRERLAWSERIRDAMVAERFVLFEQPIVSVRTGNIERAEILLRMVGDDGEHISPGAFLDVAERFGQIQELDRWVIARTIELQAEREATGSAGFVEVNLSGASITDSAVIDFIAAEVRAAGIDPTMLTFEVTETAAIVNIDHARHLASRLADLGCRFALDDFGSGFGSFYYLKHLPFDVVKIDGDFIKDLPRSRTDQLTVQAIVQIADGMGKQTVAEFVQDAETMELLAELGVDFAQGYFVGMPVPAVAAGSGESSVPSPQTGTPPSDNRPSTSR